MKFAEKFLTAAAAPRRFAAFKWTLFALCLVPAAAAVFAVFVSASPPPDPVEFLLGESGEWALRFLVATLAMTPLRLIFNTPAPVKLRRMFGLYAFFYTAGHFQVYLLLDLQLDFAHVWEDIVERKFITVGFAALVLMLPLAITSNTPLIKKMGFAAWQKLHRAVYAVGILGAVHYLWLEKSDDWGEPLFYLFLICALLAFRLPAAQTFIKRARR